VDLRLSRPLGSSVGNNLGTVHARQVDRTLTYLDESALERALRLGASLVRTGQGWSGYERG
jgi:hypothetical protein